MKTAFVTGSQAEFAIAAEHLAAFGIDLEHVALDLTEIQSASVEAIAAHKAAQAFEILRRACMVEDSAFGLDFTDRSAVSATFATRTTLRVWGTCSQHA